MYLAVHAKKEDKLGEDELAKELDMSRYFLAKILSNKIYARNSQLAEKCTPKGIFPLFAFILPNKKKPTYIKYTSQSAITFVSIIKSEMT